MQVISVVASMFLSRLAHADFRSASLAQIVCLSLGDMTAESLSKDDTSKLLRTVPETRSSECLIIELERAE